MGKKWKHNSIHAMLQECSLLSTNPVIAERFFLPLYDFICDENPKELFTELLSKTRESEKKRTTRG